MIRPLSVRSRLTLLYTGLVLAAGLLLTTLTYLLLFGHLRLFIPDAMSMLLTRAVPALLVVTVLAGLTGWLVAGRILRPIRTMTAAANRLSAKDLSERIPVGQPVDELATLAATINGMLDRIQHGVAERDRVLTSQRLFVANAAHELRTPLTTIRTAVDVTLDGAPDRAELVAMAADVAAAAEASQRTLDGLLILAHSQAGLLRRTPVDLAEVTATAVAALAAQAAADGVTLHTDLRPAATSGEPVLLEGMATNLLDNALRYNHMGGEVTVTSGTAHGYAFLRIVNTGPPLTPDEQRRLFEPFVRGSANGTRGAGLGLSIVREVVTAHDGEILCTARLTGGMDVAVHLPRTSDPDLDADPRHLTALVPQPVTGRARGAASNLDRHT
jgi:signal transduction histidine kinase